MRFLPLAFVALLVACPAPAPSTPGAPEAVLRAYDVPQAVASETQNVLSSLLYRGKDVPKLGSVVLSPSGQLLVSAPVSFHQGVEQVVAQLRKGPPEPPPAVELDYVAVLARPGEPATPSGLDASTAAVLEDIAKREGVEMAIYDRVRLRSASGDRAHLGDERLRVSQLATVHGAKILAGIELDGQGRTRLEARVQLTPDEPLILARAGYEPRPGEPFYEDGGPKHVALFYVVRARVIE